MRVCMKLRLDLCEDLRIVRRIQSVTVLTITPVSNYCLSGSGKHTGRACSTVSTGRCESESSVAVTVRSSTEEAAGRASCWLLDNSNMGVTMLTIASLGLSIAYRNESSGDEYDDDGHAL